MERRRYGDLPAEVVAGFDSVRAGAIACTACPLHKTRDQVVIYRGEGLPRVLFVGEAPGASENRVGLPFVGRAGDILDSKIVEIGLRDFGILNVVNCQPIGNDLQPEEIRACSPFLRRKLDLLSPFFEILVLLGRKPERTVSRDYLFTLKKQPKYVLPILHPAALLHSRGPQFLGRWDEHWADLTKKARLLGILHSTPPRSTGDKETRK